MADPNPTSSTQIGSSDPLEMAFAPAAGPNSGASRRSKRSQNGPAQSSRIDSPSSGRPTAEDELVDRTKQQIRTLVNEISELAKSDCTTDEFYRGFLTKTAGALACEGGAIWVRDAPDQPLQVQYQINLHQTALADDLEAQKKHLSLLAQIAKQGEPTIVGPQSESSSEQHGGNPTDNLLVVGPLIVSNETVGVVEIFQRPGAGPATQRGYLRFLMQMCDIASDFLTTQKIRGFESQQAMWSKFEQYIQSVHQGLNTDQTTYVVANEGRRMIDCDRVSVVMKRGRRCQVKAVSGLDSIERRADQVKRLAGLAKATIKGAAPIWYTGDDQNLPPQIETRLHQYVDQSHSKMLAIVPLYRATPSIENETTGSRTPKKQAIGALVVEQLKDATVTTDLEKRVDVVAQHAAAALTNSLEHNEILLLPLWKFLGKIAALFQGVRLLKTTAVLTVIAAIVAFFCLFPYPFTLSAKGMLIPKYQHQVYAQIAGVIDEVYVSDQGDTVVKQGQLLAKMSNNDLAVVIENLRSKIEEAKARRDANIGLRANSDLDSYQQTTLEIEIEQALEEIKGLESELQLRLTEREHLRVVSQWDGVVTNWQARQNLDRLPVERGQNLMTIIEPDSDWILELELPERRVGHLVKWSTERKQAPRVTFGLLSHPGKEFEGQLTLVDQQIRVHSDEGSTCLVRVAFDNSVIDRELLRSGTRVNAKIECGTESIGYVLFHEVIETVQSAVLLWF